MPGDGAEAQFPSQALGALLRAMGALESHLGGGRRFLLGEAPTLADVAVICALLPPFCHVSPLPPPTGSPPQPPPHRDPP